MLNEYKTVIPYVRKYWYSYVLGLFFLFLTNAGQLLIPQILRRTVDFIYNGGGSENFIGRNTLLIVGLAVLVAIGRFFWRYFIHGVSRTIEATLRQRLFDHLLVLGHDFFSAHKTGDIMARATNDLNHVRMATGMALIAFADGLFMSMAILIILFRQNVNLAGLTILPLPVITLIILFFGKMIGPLFRKVQSRFSALSGHVQETLSGIRVVKAFHQEDFFAGKFALQNDEYKEANMSLIKIWGLYFPVIAFLSGISTVLLLIFGGQAVIAGSFSPGDFTAFLSYLGMLVWPLLGAGFTVNMIQRGGASLKRINEILQYEPLIRNVDEPVEMIRSSRISVSNLSYTHPGEKDPVLKDISFDLEEGEILGILGRTGSGKSTLLSILTRRFEPPEWSVLVDGVDVRMYEINQLRRHFAIVPQESFLFSTTIEENIRFGVPKADHEAVLAAARLSTIDRDVESFPGKWKTEVGERGVILSGGQKQRVAISRALILDPPVLVFDDALSAVDTETESKILKHLLQERAGKTSIVVSNRISTLQYADKVIVLDKGRIVESGKPQDLLGAEGIYTDIARLQKFTASGEE